MNNIVLSKISILILAFACAAGLYFLFGKILILIMPFLFGFFISRLTIPVVDFLKDRLKVPRGLSALSLIFGFIFLIGYGLVTLLNFLAKEFMKISGLVPLWTKSLISYFQEVSLRFETSHFDLPFSLSGYLAKGVESFMGKLGDLSANLGSHLLLFVTSVPNILFFIVIAFVSAFFMAKDKEKISAWISPITRGAWTQNKHLITIKTDVFGVLWGYVKAQLILMCLTFVESSIGLLIIGVSYPIPIAFGIACIDALPILGPATVYIPWVISKIVVGNYTTALYLFILYLVVTLARQALEPKILSSQIGIYPLLTLFSMYAGLKIIGVLGIILGPMFLILIQTLFRTGILPIPKIFLPILNEKKKKS